MRRINLDALRLPHDACGQLHDSWRKCGAEHHGLFALNRQLINFCQVVSKTKVQHAVGFIHHKKLHLVQLDLQTALQVKQAPRCGYYQIGILQFSDLQLVRNTAHHIGNAQTAAVTNQVNRIGAYLLSQLTGRAQDQSARCGRLKVPHVGRVFALRLFEGRFTALYSLGAQPLKLCFLIALGLFLLHQQRVQNGQQKCSCLAATGLA